MIVLIVHFKWETELLHLFKNYGLESCAKHHFSKMRWRQVWLSGLQVHISRSCWASHPPTPPGCSPGAALRSLSAPPGCVCARGWPNSPAPGLADLHKADTDPALQPVENPLDDIPSLQCVPDPPSSAPSAHPAGVPGIPKVLDQRCETALIPQSRPWGASLLPTGTPNHEQQLGVWSSSQLLIHRAVHLSNPHLSNFHSSVLLKRRTTFEFLRLHFSNNIKDILCKCVQSWLMRQSTNYWSVFFIVGEILNHNIKNPSLHE